MARTQVNGIAIMALLFLYLAGYAACRKVHVLVHTANVLNVDFHGRYHMIYAPSNDSLVGHAAEFVFWPLREIEARWHGRGGRLN